MNGDTIYHLRYGNADYFFGSVAAIYDVFTSDVLGVTKRQLWQFGISERHPFSNGICTITRGVIRRRRTRRRLPRQHPIKSRQI